jgi:Kdo2-lipid IVA lauroyltransferase/acyltransferase
MRLPRFRKRRPLLVDLRHRAEYVVFRLFACVLTVLTVPQTIRLAELIADVLTSRPLRKVARYRVAAENLRASFGDHLTDQQVDRTIRAMWIHLVRVFVEVVQLPRKMTLTNCREVIVFRNRAPVLKALCSGRPVFILGGHFGNWEVSTATFGMFGFPLGIVARRLDNPYLHKWFFEARQQTGHQLYDKHGGANEMIELLEAGGNLGLLCDQDAGYRGLFVNFFGRPASTFKSIALMALQYRALLVVGYGIRLPDDPDARWVRYEIGCEEVIDTLEFDHSRDALKTITQRYTAALERAIRRAPEQYFWVHRRWKSQPGDTADSRRERKREAA